MVLPVQFKPPTMYFTQPLIRTEIEKLVREHHRNNLLGQDGKINLIAGPNPKRIHTLDNRHVYKV
ncbi:hypothetical protein LIPSTDRAFT_225266 [Lipomyces starkeyi NRRL Y-11557]|uniref:Uncharacterized protein n=1 Tax=Lipomyces starkeyi NRRL Y-11557 TaxID=675824 RepID=A0A1E3PTU6_LIPST|nr:hypothetical protein LIPSTDRAFT_225266 [Lipomyces starkeyi NRRL Y-11557]